MKRTEEIQVAIALLYFAFIGAATVAAAVAAHL
jgi:hypothetical protein